MLTLCRMSEHSLGMGLDLETYRRAKGLSYRQLVALIGSNHASRTRSWAIGEVWPDADVLKTIVEVTGGEVTLDAMHEKRLQWLRERDAKLSAEEPEENSTRDEDNRCSEGSPR